MVTFATTSLVHFVFCFMCIAWFLISNIYIICTMSARQMYKELIKNSDNLLKVIYIIGLSPAWIFAYIKAAKTKGV